MCNELVTALENEDILRILLILKQENALDLINVGFEQKCESPLNTVIRENDQILIDLFLQAGANVNIIGNFRLTPLMIAVTQGNFLLTKKLIESGADINAEDGFSDTVLMMACRYEQRDIVEFLCVQGADINKFGSDGTALHESCEYDDLNTVKVLIEHGSDIHALNKDMYSALMIACSGNSADLIRHLVEVGARIDLVDEEGITALMVVCENEILEEKLEVVKFMIDAGADALIKNNSGEYAHTIAYEKGFTEVGDYLSRIVKKGTIT